MNKISVVFGLMMGDEAKGRVANYFAPAYDVIYRYNGGSNAGHTIYTSKENKVIFHLLPSASLHKHKTIIIGPAVRVNLGILVEEIKMVENMGISLSGRLLIDPRAHIVTREHISRDKQQEESKKDDKLGTTLQGIGPCNEDRAKRTGRRIIDIEPNECQNIAFLHEHGFIYDTISYTKDISLSGGESILFEGAQGVLLDPTFGHYPHVTSASVMPQEVVKYLSHTDINYIGVFKPYVTQVGSGPFPTLEEAIDGELRVAGDEFGATTGRPRKCGWLDIPALKYTINVSNPTELILTKLDVLDTFDEIKICVRYKKGAQTIYGYPISAAELETVEPVYITMDGWKKDTSIITEYMGLPREAREFIEKIEKLLNQNISYISTRPYGGLIFKKRGD